jgi:hypothetical protein
MRRVVDDRNRPTEPVGSGFGNSLNLLDVAVQSVQVDWHNRGHVTMLRQKELEVEWRDRRAILDLSECWYSTGVSYGLGRRDGCQAWQDDALTRPKAEGLEREQESNGPRRDHGDVCSKTLTHRILELRGVPFRTRRYAGLDDLAKSIDDGFKWRQLRPDERYGRKLAGDWGIDTVFVDHRAEASAPRRARTDLTQLARLPTARSVTPSASRPWRTRTGEENGCTIAQCDVIEEGIAVVSELAQMWLKGDDVVRIVG